MDGSVFVSGAIAGVTASLFIQPLDVIKTQQQASVTTCAVDARFASVASRVVKNEGVLGLWNGLGPSALRASMGPGLYFAILNAVQSSTPKDPGFAQTFLASAFARGSATVILNPISVIKTRFEYQDRRNRPPGFSNTFRAISTVMRTEKLRGLFSGLAPTLVRDIPFSGLYLVLYQDVFKAQVAKSESLAHVPQIVTNTACAFASGALATMATHPADVIKTQAQIHTSKASTANPFSRIVRTAQAILQTKGVKGLFAGLLPRLVRRPISVSVTWGLYEHLVPLFGGTLRS